MESKYTSALAAPAALYAAGALVLLPVPAVAWALLARGGYLSAAGVASALIPCGALAYAWAMRNRHRDALTPPAAPPRGPLGPGGRAAAVGPPDSGDHPASAGRQRALGPAVLVCRVMSVLVVAGALAFFALTLWFVGLAPVALAVLVPVSAAGTFLVKDRHPVAGAVAKLISASPAFLLITTDAAPAGWYMIAVCLLLLVLTAAATATART